MHPNSILQPYDFSPEEADNSINENFVFGQPGRQVDSRQQNRSSFTDSDKNNNNRPVGVVQPQSAVARDGFKVLPSAVQLDRSNLKPTAVNVKSNRYSDVSTYT